MLFLSMKYKSASVGVFNKYQILFRDHDDLKITFRGIAMTLKLILNYSILYTSYIREFYI